MNYERENYKFMRAFKTVQARKRRGELAKAAFGVWFAIAFICLIRLIVSILEGVGVL